MISPTSRWFVFMLAAMNAMTALAVDTSLPAMPAIGTEFAAGPERVQLTLSLFMFGYSFGQILAGPLSDRFGRRPMLLIGLSVYTLSGLGCALAGSIDQLIVLRTIQAMAAACGPSMSRAIIRDYHGGPRASHMLSTVQLAMGFALVAAPVVGSLIMSFANWRGIFLFLAVFGGILWVVVWFGFSESLTLPDPQAVNPSRLLKNFMAFFGNRLCAGYAAVNGFVQGGLLAFISGIPFVMTDVFHIPPTRFGFYFAMAAMGLIFGASLNRRLVRGHPPDWILRRGLFVQSTAGCVLFLLAWLMVPVFPNAIIFMLPVMAYSFSQGLVMPNAIAGAMEPLPYMAGFAAALIGAVQMGSGGVTGYIVNALYDGTAMPLAALLAVLACCGLATYHLVIYRRA